MVVQDIYPVRSKIVIDNVVLEGTTVQLLGYDLTYKDDKDMAIKVNRIQNVCGTNSRTLINGGTL